MIAGVVSLTIAMMSFLVQSAGLQGWGMLANDEEGQALFVIFTPSDIKSYRTIGRQTFRGEETMITSLPMVDVIEALRTRRTVRQYVPGYVIPSDVLGQIVDLALDAPTGKNCQEVDLVVVTNAAKLDEIGGLAYESFPAEGKKYWDGRRAEYGVTNVVTCNASAVILLYGNERANTEFAQVDAGIISMVIMAAARQFGLATMCLGALLYGGKAGIEAAVGIPPGSLLMAVAIGKPVDAPKLLDKTRLAKATFIA